VERTEKKRGGSGAKLDTRFHPGVGTPNAIFRVGEPLAAVGTHVSCGVKKRFRTGKTSDRPWAEGFATDSRAASGIIPK
jgi:hypothetical protein